jgi:hypothetical protein
MLPSLTRNLSNSWEWPLILPLSVFGSPVHIGYIDFQMLPPPGDSILGFLIHRRGARCHYSWG